jgi:hypothetical protein
LPDIFNTECQLFKTPPAKPVYGSGIATPTAPFVKHLFHGASPPEISPAPRLPIQLVNLVLKFF